jgi:nitroreductase
MPDIDENVVAQETKLKPPEPGAPYNAVEDVIYRRRSIRFYQKKQVPEYLVRRVLEAGRFAPSAGNAQPWKFIVVQDPKMIQEMTDDVVRMCRLLMKGMDYLEPGKNWRRAVAKLTQRLRRNEFHPIPFGAMKLIAEGKLGVWHGAPTVIPILVDRRAPGKPMMDVGIAGQNMVLAAHSLGLGTCWVSFVTPLEYYPKWKKRLGMRYPYKLASSIALGYPKGNPDGQVSRETQAVDWYTENGTMKVVY